MQRSVLDYFEHTVKKYTDKCAVVDSNGQITFREMKNKALQIAGFIKKQSDVVKSPVLIYLPKSKEKITAFIGILYSGNFYTPTDVNFPFSRVAGMIEQLKPKFIITDNMHKGVLLENGIDKKFIINIDECNESCIHDGKYLKTIDTDVVYVLFTSGSTGVPKGVAISNRSIIDYIDWARETYQVDAEDIIGNQAPLYFDNSTLDIYLMLSTGATLHIIPEKYFAFPAKLLQYVKNYNINMIFWVPSVLINVSNNDLLAKMDCTCLNKILFAGEIMPNKHLNYWRKHIPEALYSNLYGPTEITVDCTYYIVDREFSDNEPLPIGIPCLNSDVLVLDDENNLVCDAGIQGELCVRGSSLALGYWNNPEKTAEVFVQNPLNEHLPELIYRTGDLVYYNDSGEIMFTGRKDFQIKHMGYRIELGEIEIAAGGIEGIKNVSVCYDMDSRKIIMFYQAAEVLDVGMLRKKLQDTIPKYMLPTIYVPVDAFRMTDNGKIDRKAMIGDYLLMLKRSKVEGKPLSTTDFESVKPNMRYKNEKNI